jgi:hypothetical protein
MKIWSGLLVSLIGLFLIGIIAGCSTVQSSTTTTSGASTTTTYFGPATTTTTYIGPSTTTLVSYSVSGTISWSWGSRPNNEKYGMMVVLATTNESDPQHISMEAMTVGYIATGAACSKGYTISNLQPKNYYILCAIFVATYETSQSGPRAGDIIGHYSNGYVPATWQGFSPTGDGQPVNVNGNKTGIDFTPSVIFPSH